MNAPRRLRAIGVACLFLSFGACTASLSGKAITGQVIDGSTNRPLPGAIVVATWEGDIASFPESRRTCYHVASAKSDDQGFYRVPGWKKNITAKWQKNLVGTQVHLLAFHTGYTHGYRVLDGTRKEDIPFIMSPDKRAREARLEDLWTIFSSMSCDQGGRSGQDLLPLFEAVFYESKKLATTDKDKQTLKLMRELAASAWIHRDEPLTGDQEIRLREQFLRDHLQ